MEDFLLRSQQQVRFRKDEWERQVATMPEQNLTNAEARTEGIEVRDAMVDAVSEMWFE
jgi:hypothetical protein